ncbi:hypothetical protein IEQ34_015783 [Dendrobium chrysotoxum]|uniref:Uncharacterized protein n=1 Tax=Dendrobium chrysotoxum TaxID=161865 RepID=A0AAV7GI37_DENCH|nr:hypothetical protein IEQ34_015783 [Dendrobium chrysotoxum]
MQPTGPTMEKKILDFVGSNFFVLLLSIKLNVSINNIVIAIITKIKKSHITQIRTFRVDFEIVSISFPINIAITVFVWSLIFHCFQKKFLSIFSIAAYNHLYKKLKTSQTAPKLKNTKFSYSSFPFNKRKQILDGRFYLMEPYNCGLFRELNRAEKQKGWNTRPLLLYKEKEIICLS